MDSEFPAVQRISSIHQIGAMDWNACAGEENPFLRHEFFSSLEDSGTACPQQGWQPCHFLLFHEQRLIGIAPTFLKVHSEGEFVFDYSWAAAYQRLGRAYYPKLQCAVPYTPVSGPRYLIHPDFGEPQWARKVLRLAQVSLAEGMNLSSLHVTFCQENEYQEVGEPWLPRLGIQFHFPNPGYSSFSDFLGQLSSRKRKAILKERRAVEDSGLHLQILTGQQLGQEHVDLLFRCYRQTTSRKWGRAALTKEFFALLFERMADRVVLMVASRGSQGIAAALNLRGRQALFGRNWGALEEYPYLHFELCYYQAIDYAIAEGLTRVEAGAQGFHKMARGYLPQFTYSQHWIADPFFRDLLKQALIEERREILQQHGALQDLHSPYRKGNA